MLLYAFAMHFVLEFGPNEDSSKLRNCLSGHTSTDYYFALLSFQFNILWDHCYKFLFEYNSVNLMVI